MSRRFVSLLLLIIILIGGTSLTYAYTGNSKVDWLIDKGYVKGDERGYRLRDNITRAEATKMIVEANGLGNLVDSWSSFPSMFTDVNKTHWANGYINVAVINSLVNGYPDKTFKPSSNITYAEVIKMLVMAYGEKLNTEGFTGTYWFLPYNAKADEVGIIEGVKISNYYDNATREKVFELVYNTIYKKTTKDLEEYKGIVVENSRVSNLNRNEIRLVILEEFTDSTRYSVDDEIKITIPSNIADTESILGMVVDIVIDKNNNAISISLDDSYLYTEGPILTSEYDVYLGADGNYYSYDKIKALYHNDRNYNYYDYLDSLGDYDQYGEIGFVAEFARVTTRNGKVYFIDSYTFDDIAPVNSVRNYGKDIYIYNDLRDGAISRIELDSIIGYSYGDGLFAMDIDEIHSDDIVHIYDKYKAIVRTDAKSLGEYEKIVENKGFYYAQIEGSLYQIRESDGRKPIYSLNARDYYTLYAEEALEELYTLRYKDVIYLLDINNHIQSISKY